MGENNDVMSSAACRASRDVNRHDVLLVLALSVSAAQATVEFLTSSSMGLLEGLPVARITLNRRQPLMDDMAEEWRTSGEIPSGVVATLHLQAGLLRFAD